MAASLSESAYATIRTSRAAQPVGRVPRVTSYPHFPSLVRAIAGSGEAMEDEGAGLESYAGHNLSWSDGVIAFLDVMESVRLTARDGGLFITRWIEQRGAIEAMFQGGGGRVVRSTGDGIIGHFPDAGRAVATLFSAIAQVDRANAAHHPALPIAIRIGLARGEFLIDKQDVYGQAVNLAARLAGLGQPGQVIVSDAVRAELVDGVDARIEDLGACFLKHIEEPVRAYGLRPVGANAVPSMPQRLDAQLVPTLAILPLVAVGGEDPNDPLGEVIADELISTLSGSLYLNIISRLSSSAIRQRNLSPLQAGETLWADYIVSGSYSRSQGRIRVSLEMMERRTGLVRLDQRFAMPLSALVEAEHRGFESFIASLIRAVMQTEIQRVRRCALPSLESHSLLLAAVTMMHRPSEPEFRLAAEILTTLMERHPREPLPRAWLACWYTIKAQKGLATDPVRDSTEAQGLTRHAMDLEPENPLALSVAGLIATNFSRRFDEAAHLLEKAVEINPNETYALLHKAALLQFTDRGGDAYPLARRALALSPFDPHRYYFEAIIASAAFSSGSYEAALAHASEAVRANRLYPSGSRVRTASLFHLGRVDEAREAAQTLLAVEPGLTVSNWLKKSPAADFDVGKRLAEGLRGAGIPET